MVRLITTEDAVKKMTLKQSALETGRGDEIRPLRLRQERRLLFPALALGGVILCAYPNLGCSSDSLRLKPDSALVHFNFGKEFDRAEKYSEAEQEYREAIRLNPKYSLAYGALAFLLFRKGTYTEAETVYRDQLRLTPKNLHALMGLATTLDKQGRRTEARPVWKKALRRAKGGEPLHVIKKRLAEPQ